MLQHYSHQIYLHVLPLAEDVECNDAVTDFLGVNEKTSSFAINSDAVRLVIITCFDTTFPAFLVSFESNDADSCFLWFVESCDLFEFCAFFALKIHYQ